MSVIPADIEAVMRAAAADLEDRIAACHDVVACPKCKAPVGTRCVFRPAGAAGGFVARRTLKHPHKQRWTLVVPAR